MIDNLISDVNKKIDNWNERSQFTVKGVRNLSRSDMDDLLMAAEYFQLGYSDFCLYGDTLKVWKAYGLPTW